MLRREYSCANFNSFLELDLDNHSQTQTDFYPKKSNYLNTENNQYCAPNPKIFNSVEKENFMDIIYVEDSFNSLNYKGKPVFKNNFSIIGGEQFYEFTCVENKFKYLGKIDYLFTASDEFNILKNLSHKNILFLYRYFTEDGNTYMLYENCGSITLKQYLEKRKKLSENEVRFIISELINLLKYLKSQNIIHRNLSLENIIVTKSGGIKVMGFNSAIKLTPGQKTVNEKINLLTPPLVYAPEILNLNKEYIDYDVNYSYEIDVWAVGHILYTLLIGNYPPQILPSTNMYIFTEKIPFISNKARDCIYRLLEPDPKKRQKLNQIFMLPFFEDN